MKPRKSKTHRMSVHERLFSGPVKSGECFRGVPANKMRQLISTAYTKLQFHCSKNFAKKTQQQSFV